MVEGMEDREAMGLAREAGALEVASEAGADIRQGGLAVTDLVAVRAKVVAVLVVRRVAEAMVEATKVA